MTQIDQFESVFKAASRTLYQHQPVCLRKVLVISDLNPEGTEALTERLRTFLAALDKRQRMSWQSTSAEAYDSVGDMLDQVARAEPDLICTYRNLKTNAWRWPYTLGDHLEVLTQVSPTPILVVPRPEHEAHARALRATQTVMAITDHLTGDDRLVNHAVSFTATGVDSS